MLEVIEPGLFTTVQDLGRHGYQEFGVSVGGAMDPYALRLANMLLDNDEGDACLETTLTGPSLVARGTTVVAITGADMSPQVNGIPAPSWGNVLLGPGDVLSFGRLRHGLHAYLAVPGGIDVPAVMGSRSTDIKARIGGVEGRQINKGDRLRPRRREIDPGLARRRLPGFAISPYDDDSPIRVIPGPQDDYFTAESIDTFFRSAYTITDESNRMGYRLDGPTLLHSRGADIVSDATPLGAIQVPSHGKPIVLMADRQTTGGYPKIGVVAGVDIPRLAQLRSGDTVRFARVAVAEAHRLLRQREELLARAAVRAGSWLAGETRHYLLTLRGKRHEISVETMRDTGGDKP